ncbi:ThiF family adenylyltransferase [Methylophilus sp. 5]|uniref:ThiF family adenylyltransferase n=1 Tax=Methylophilus sp. 5 TaxID=1112274 RepID=UPI0004BCA519|nr:ThiF family adenylyltransferase [Methylophilus sp. 5]
MKLSQPIGPDLGLTQLIDDGFKVVVEQGHIKILNVPFVTSSKIVSRGTLICPYISNAGIIQPPENHQVWWTEEYPCLSNGVPIEPFRNEDGVREIYPGCTIKHRFSNKPVGVDSYPNYYCKLTHYLYLIQAQAKVIDSSVDAKDLGNDAEIMPESTGPFAYSDTASVRAEIKAITARLEHQRIAVVGVGGTGSYILDQLAKTPVKEIHLFDGDVFEQHNAFRAPGAATFEEISLNQPKTRYFKTKYQAMHTGIFEHPHHLDATNLHELTDFNFVFLSVDNGTTRKLIYEHLKAQSIPFIDVGMNLYIDKNIQQLAGACRATLYQPGSEAFFEQNVPLSDGNEEDAVYKLNIQIADMNALNAQLAVMKWKQFSKFYRDDFDFTNALFTVNFMSLNRNKKD